MAEILASGICGENVTWTLDDTGLLSISGEGLMPDWSSHTAVPWWTHRQSIVKVKIENGITNIGNLAFCSHTGLENVEIPEGVTHIGEDSFSYCHKLTTLKLPESLISIGGNAFKGGAGIVEMTIPKKVTEIGFQAYYSCSNLENIFVSEENEVYCSRNGILYNKEGTELLQCPGGKKGAVNVITGVETIAEYAFARCRYLTDVVFPDSIVNVKEYAFEWSKILNLTMSEGVASIENFAFLSCEGLSEITIPTSVIHIGHQAFSSCCDLVSINVSPDNTAYCSVDGVLYNKEQTTLIEYPCGRTGSYSVLPTVTFIKDTAFWDCEKLTGVIIPEGITELMPSMFRGCYQMYYINIPDSVLKIGGTVFEDTVLTDVYYAGSPSEWETIDVDEWNDRLHSATIHYGRSDDGIRWSIDENGLLTVSGAGMIPDCLYAEDMLWHAYQTAITGVVIETGITGIGSRSFYGCSNMMHIVLPETVSYIGEEVFTGCSVETLRLPNAVAGIDRNTGICKDSSVRTVVFGGGPATRIGANLLQGCAQLKNIWFEDDTIFDTIGAGAFSACGCLNIVTLPASVTTIGSGAFTPATGRKNVSVCLPASVTSIAEDAFGEDSTVYIHAPQSDCYAKAYAESHGYYFSVIGLSETVGEFYWDYTKFGTGMLTNVPKTAEFNRYLEYLKNTMEACGILSYIAPETAVQYALFKATKYNNIITLLRSVLPDNRGLRCVYYGNVISRTRIDAPITVLNTLIQGGST